MKKYLSAIALLLTYCCVNTQVYGTYTILRDASNLSRGTLDPYRVNSDTFTMRGHMDGLIAGITTTTVQIDNLTTSTNSLKTEIDLVRIATGSYAVAVYTDTTTLQSRINQIATDTATLRNRINQLSVDTGSVKNVLALDTATLLSMVTFANNATSSNSILNDNQNIWISSVTNRINGIATAITTNSVTASNTNYISIGISTLTVNELVVSTISTNGNNTSILKIRNSQTYFGTYPYLGSSINGTSDSVSIFGGKPVVNGANPKANLVILATTTTNGDINGGSILFGADNGSGLQPMAMIVGINDTLSSITGGLVFATRQTNMAERMRLDYQGFLGLNTSAPTSMLDIVNGSITVRGTSSGLRISGLANNATVGTDSSGNFIAGSGGGGGAGNSTMSFTLGAGGDVYQATYTFIPIQGASRMVSQSTETTVSMQAFTLFPSTVASTFFKIAKSTATDAGISTAWTYISPHMEVSTGQVYGPIISTAIIFNANESYALHCTSFPVTGMSPAEYGVKIRYWNNPYP